ncbi:MAG: hypothetical protein MUP27_09270 [Desulfobacterales bacterium]|nr:hypothetical protein [Desulfobacterales bacterium]
MSTGGWIGAILGFIVGFVVSGFSIVGGIYGAIIGYSLGSIIDPVKPDVKQPGAPTVQGLQVMTNVIGNPIFDVLGTAKITGQMLFFGKEFHSPKWARIQHQTQVIGWRYYASWALGICMGPTDVLYTVFRDQDPIWEGELTRPESGGEATIQIEGGGTMVFYFGTDDQMPNVNAGTLLPDPTLNTGYRHLCWAFFDAFFMNEYNRMPSMSFVVKKILPMFDEPTSQIQVFDINPAHALWHTLIEKAGLPVEWVDPVDFLAVATELFGEGRGISILFDVHQATLNYLEAINSHVDCILRYGSDGKFHPKLIRYVSPAGLSVIDESKLLEEPTFSRRSWIDTINEVKVQYSEILGDRIPPWVEYEYPFRIYDMRISGDDIFVCGSKDLTYGNWAAVVARINLNSGEMLDYGEFYPFPGSAYYLGIEVDETDVYLAGSCLQSLGGTHEAIIHKRSRINLSPVAWSWTWAVSNGGWLETRDVCLDDGFVYGTISYSGGCLVGRCKVAKSNGAQQWALYGQPTSPGGILNVGSYIYVSKHSGGYYCIEKVNKTTGTIVETTYVSGAFNRGMSDGTYLWLGGERHPYYWYKTVTKILISSMSEIWRYEELGGVSITYVPCWRAIADADGVYMIGQDDSYSSTPYYQKIAANGSSSIWLVQDSLNVNKRVYFALCQTVDLLYIGTFDQITNLSTIRRYNKTDGVLVTG